MTVFSGKNETGPGLVKLNGPLLGSRADEAANMFRSLFRQGVRRLVVDLAGVPVIDSLGLAALVAGYRLFGSGPQAFRLVALQEQPRLVLELTGFDHIFQIFDNAPTAMAVEPATRRSSAYGPVSGPAAISQPLAPQPGRF